MYGIVNPQNEQIFLLKSVQPYKVYQRLFNAENVRNAKFGVGIASLITL
nr:MAG TPA: hypothetical protein [Caudoviricetes sp.]